jgi:TRAP-type C4-dicarboxylate transport system substrate-binding protein
VTHPLFKIWNRFFEEVKTESKGKLLFQVYAAESLHGGKDGFKACVNNITDWTMGYPSWQAGSFNLTHVIEMPFAFPTTYVASIVAEELYPKYFKKEYEKLGVYLGDFHTTTPTHILSKKPIRKLDDLKGMKVRTSGGVTSDILKSLGGVPVFLPTPEIYNAFQRGMIDGVLTTKQDHVAFRTHEVGKYLLELGAYMIPIPTCLNQKTFDGLPKDLRKMFYSQLRRLSQLAPTINETSEKEGVEAMKKAGVEIISLSPAEFAKAQKMVEPLWEEFIKKNEAKGAPAKQMVEDFRSLSKKYSSWTPQQLMKKVTDEPIRGIIDGM